METFKKTVYIPPNHHLKFDLKLPDNFPIGETEILLVFSATSSKTNNKGLLNLAGALKESPHFKDDPLSIQKRLRDEWKD